MRARSDSIRARAIRWFLLLELSAGSLSLAWLSGCIEPPARISLEEFLELVAEEERVVDSRRLALTVGAPPNGQVDGSTTAPSNGAEVGAKTIVDEQLGPYRVGPSDILGIRVTLLDQLEIGAAPAPVQVRVDRNGDLNLPLVGTLHVEGMEIEDVEDEIERAYVPRVYKDAIVSVALIEVKVTQVIMRGAVGQSGLIRLRRTERNLLYAMDSAGGMSAGASGRVSVTRLRRPAESASFNLADPVELRAALFFPPLEEGDIITAEPAQGNTIYIWGAWGATQVYPAGYSPRIMEVIAQANGFRKNLNVEEATLIRRMANGQEVFVKIYLQKHARGEAPNFKLKGGDIIWSNWTAALYVADFVNANVFTRFGLTASASYSASSSDTLNNLGGTDAPQSSGTGGTTLQDQFDPFGFFFQPIPAVVP